MSTLVATILEDLGSEETRKRVNAVKNLSTLAATLGPEKTRSDLISYLEDVITEDDDEVILELLEVIVGFLDYMGGVNYFERLLKLLENFCKSFESSIRNKAINAVKKIFLAVDIKNNEEIIVNFIKKCFSSEFHCGKEAVAVLIPFVYQKISSNTQSLFFGYFMHLLTNENPMVRKFGAMNFSSLIQILPPNMEKEVLEVTGGLVKDNQDLIRIYSIDVVISLFVYVPANRQNSILALFKTLSDDGSWRIRYVICEKASEVGEKMSKENLKNIFLPFYLKCLQDPEPELRSVAAGNLNKLCKYLDLDTIVAKITPFFKTILNDAQCFVKISLADSLLQICPFMGKKGTTDYILPIFLNLLKTPEAEIRINLFKNLGEMTKILGIEGLLVSIIPAFQELSTDKNWRTRKLALEYLSVFAKQIGPQFFTEKINKIIINDLSDKVFSVREATANALKDCIEILGLAWFEQNILPSVLKFSSVQNYLFRQTLILIFINISQLLSGSGILNTVFQIILELAKDPVANIRASSCKGLRIYHKLVGQSDKEKIKKAFSLLLNDTDLEVKYTAKANFDAL